MEGLLYLGAASVLFGGGVFVGLEMSAARIRLLKERIRGLEDAVEQGGLAADAVADVLEEERELADDELPPGIAGIRMLLNPDRADPPEGGTS